MARKRRKLPTEPIEATIEDLSHDGRGVCRVDGKVTFVHGALPGEQVRFKLTSRRRDLDEGEVVEVIAAAPERVEARCPHVGQCGGCALQHLAPETQIARKQETLLENLRRIGEVEPTAVIAPLTAASWGYRRRARLSARHVAKKHRTLVGFRERAGRFVADLQECHVLIPDVGFRIAELGALLDRLEAHRDIPQIEIAAGDDTTVLVIRHMVELSGPDREVLAAFEERTGLRVVLQSGGPKSLVALRGDLPRLHYALGDLELEFTATNFVQVNAPLNAAMVELAVDKLALEAGQTVVDLFCGLGNFSLPIARRCGEVLGIEGDDELVALAAHNAARNGIENARFERADLREPITLPACDRVLVDPPRSGALDALGAIAATGAEQVVYVSCHPGSLARDAGLLVREHGFTLTEAGVMDMFPHTAHVESIAVFDRGGRS